MCFFLFGGNDTYNMVLPTDAASWAACTATRNQAPDPIALLAAGTAPNAAAGAGTPARLGGVLPITPLNAAGLNTGRTFALHPLMGELKAMFDTDRRLAIVPNVGPLVMPTTKAHSTASRRTRSRCVSSRTTTSKAPGRRWRRRRHQGLGRPHGRRARSGQR
ncbi:MAG: hypothetical protein U1F67_07370 [Rubrivivax sp.]